MRHRTALISVSLVCFSVKADEVRLAAPYITGSSVYSVQELAPSYATHIGQPLTLARLEAIAADIQSQYRSDGYVAPLIVRTQSEISEHPHLHIHETRLAEVVRNGDAGPYDREIQQQLDSLQDGAAPVHWARTRAVLRRIEQLPGLRVQAQFARVAETANAYRLVLTTRYDAVRTVMSVHNRGLEDYGREMINARLSTHGLLGWEEALAFTGSASVDIDKYHYVGVRAARSFAPARASLELTTSRAQRADDFEYRGRRATAALSRTVFDSGVWSADPWLGLSFRSSETFDANASASDTQWRTIEAGVAVRSDATLIRSSLVAGVDAWGAESYRSRGEAADLAFELATIAINHSINLRPDWVMRGEIEGQWSDANLPAGEQFTFGGAQFGRGFDPGALVGDRGGAVSLQIERHARWAHPLLDYSRIYLQSDYGWTRDNNDGDSVEASSVTAGVSARLARVLATVELSQPLSTPTRSFDDDARAFLHMQVVF